MMAKIDESRPPTGMVLSHSFGLSSPALTAIERIALEALKQIASEGRVAYRDEIQAAIGSANMCGSTATGVVNRLVSKGYAEHVSGHPLQRALWIRIVSTNQVTAEPQCKTVHWRFRTERAPAPAIHQVAQRNKTLAQMIEAYARQLGKPIHEFLMDCVYAGFHEITAEGE